MSFFDNSSPLKSFFDNSVSEYCVDLEANLNCFVVKSANPNDSFWRKYLTWLPLSVFPFLKKAISEVASVLKVCN